MSGKPQGFRYCGLNTKAFGLGHLPESLSFPALDKLRAVSEVERHIKQRSRRSP